MIQVHTEEDIHALLDKEHAKGTNGQVSDSHIWRQCLINSLTIGVRISSIPTQEKRLD